MTDYKLVPVEPTEHMIGNAIGTFTAGAPDAVVVRQIYWAMLSAASEPVIEPYKLDVEGQFELAQGLAANCGYKLVRDEEIGAPYEALCIAILRALDAQEQKG